MVSQIKISRHAAPAAPPTWVREKNTKNAAPNVRQTHGCHDGRTSRNRMAAVIRNKIKYANVLKIIRAASPRQCSGIETSQQWGERLPTPSGKTYRRKQRADFLTGASRGSRDKKSRFPLLPLLAPVKIFSPLFLLFPRVQTLAS